MHLKLATLPSNLEAMLLLKQRKTCKKVVVFIVLFFFLSKLLRNFPCLFFNTLSSVLILIILPDVVLLFNNAQGISPTPIFTKKAKKLRTNSGKVRDRRQIMANLAD